MKTEGTQARGLTPAFGGLPPGVARATPRSCSAPLLPVAIVATVGARNLQQNHAGAGPHDCVGSAGTFAGGFRSSMRRSLLENNLVVDRSSGRGFDLTCDRLRRATLIQPMPFLLRLLILLGLARKFHTLLAGEAIECSGNYYVVEGRRDFRADEKTARRFCFSPHELARGGRSLVPLLRAGTGDRHHECVFYPAEPRHARRQDSRFAPVGGMRPCPHSAGLQICLVGSAQRSDLLGAIVRGEGTPPTWPRNAASSLNRPD